MIKFWIPVGWVISKVIGSISDNVCIVFIVFIVWLSCLTVILFISKSVLYFCMSSVSWVRSILVGDWSRNDDMSLRVRIMWVGVSSFVEFVGVKIRGVLWIFISDV